MTENLLTVNQMKNIEPLMGSVIFKGVKLPSSTAESDLWQIFVMRNKNRYVMPDNTIYDLNNTIKLLTALYAQQLNKLWATVNIEYPLIENYSMTETVESINTPNIITAQESTSNVLQESNSDTSGDTTSTSESTGNNTNAVTTYEDVASFNNTDSTLNSAEMRSNTTNNNTVTDEVKTKGESSLNTTRTGTDTTRTTTIRSGNIGVTTNQQMLQAERELATFNFIVHFMEIIEKYILLSIYE